jgi:cysteine desulfurase
LFGSQNKYKNKGKRKMIYLDSAATTQVDEKVIEEMSKYLDKSYGNASSTHYLGEESRRAVEKSRETIAKSIGASYSEIVFTSGGTESNNFAIKGLFWHYQKECPEKNHIITTKIEHDCVLNACKWLEKQGAKVTYLDVDEQGFIDLEQLKNSITENTSLVSVIHGNNEIGTIQDLKQIGEICREKGVYLHTDACQSYTKTDLNVKKMNLDFVTLNAHKIHGPKGIGVLYIKKELKEKITPLLHGGGHEFGLRSGTENVPAIVGFAKSVKIAKNRDVKKVRKLRDKLIKEILEIEKTDLNGPDISDDKGNKRLCNNINMSFNNIEGEAIGSYLNAKEIYVSTGSACSSHTLEPSHVLLALGHSALRANSSIRISLSKFNTEQEIQVFVKELKEIVEKLRKMSPLD